MSNKKGERVAMRRRIRAHALWRLQERYRINLTKEEYAQLCSDIENNRVSDTLKPFKKKSQRLSLWFTKINDKVVLIYYDKKKHLIVTFPEVRDVETLKTIFERR